MWTVLREIVGLLNESAIYLLGGFALAGVLHVVLRRTPTFTNMLAKKGAKSVILAAVLGVPLPLCSCSVVPAGLTLRKKGASKGATVSFLISTPETDITSILLTYGLFGPVMMVFRPMAALITAVAAGLATSVVERYSPDLPAAPAAPTEHCDRTEGDEYDTAKGPVWNSLHYGFVRFFDSIIGSLLLGVIVGGLIRVLLPWLSLEQWPGGSFLIMLIMLVIGIPMYVCATASTPIAAGLIAGGLSPGAAVVFLLAGPAVNIGSLLALRQYLGRSVLMTYVASVAVISLLMGLWFDAAFDAATVRAVVQTGGAEAAGLRPLHLGGVLLLLGLTWFSVRRTGLLTKTANRLTKTVGLSLGPRQVKVLAAAALLIAYLSDGVVIVGPGQQGIITRFGRIVQADLPPGLHYAWPWPIGEAKVQPVRMIKRIEIGFRQAGERDQAAGQTADARAVAESNMLTGHEDIVDIKWVVQYRVKDSAGGLEKYLFGHSDADRLAGSAAEASIRLVVGCRGIDTLLTTERRDVESAVEANLQSVLDHCDAGLAVVGVRLIEVHAPAEVQWAFRDVASAGEDKMRTINHAYDYAERVLPQAHGELSRQLAAARGGAVETVEHARGLAAAFAARLEACRENPRVTRLRLHLECADKVLPRLKKYVCLSEALCDGIELWLLQSGVDFAGPPAVASPGGGSDR